MSAGEEEEEGSGRGSGFLTLGPWSPALSGEQLVGADGRSTSGVRLGLDSDATLQRETCEQRVSTSPCPHQVTSSG